MATADCRRQIAKNPDDDDGDERDVEAMREEISRRRFDFHGGIGAQMMDHRISELLCVVSSWMNQRKKIIIRIAN